MNLYQELYQRGALGPLVVGIVSLVAAMCFFRVLLPVIAAQLRLRDNDRMSRIRVMQIVILGSLTAVLAWKAVTWIDAVVQGGAVFDLLIIHWPSDLVLGILILLGGIYAALALSTGLLRSPIVIAPVDQTGRNLHYRPEVDVALQDARTITERAEQLDQELRLLLTERARVLGENATPRSGGAPMAPSSARGG